MCHIPGCVLDNGMDGSQITLGRAASEQKKADAEKQCAVAHVVKLNK